jgi:hypothetical protein
LLSEVAVVRATDTKGRRFGGRNRTGV